MNDSTDKLSAIGDGSLHRKRTYDPNLAEELNREAELEEKRSRRKPKVETEREVVLPTGEIPPSSDENYIYVPALQLEVAKARTFQSMDWNAQQSAAHQRNERICTIHEFVEFVNYLRNDYSDKKEAKKILTEIYKTSGDWRAENLDAFFESSGGEFFINYHRFSPNGITPEKEKLLPCLMENKIPGISLDDWLARATQQGLPPEDVKSGELYYWKPVDKSVAWFDADSYGALLGCGGGPSGSGASLGVRLVRAQKNSGGFK